MERQRSILINKIEAAFSDSTLTDGMTLRKCAAIDSRIEESNPELAGISECTKWQDIPESDMHLFGTHGVLNHSGEKNAAFYLPPAMIYVLKHYNGDILHPVADIVNATEFAIESKPPLCDVQAKVASEYISWLNSI
ncbi:DUF6714 family protein [Kangiella aquimarina]|uniref:DUF6714 family protein n=1 Tax=Kangiella aquimarina TaxID=261965 RepID=A0ABZ0X717_9GAMM|nr:DUF6714 family protein [Kangiella aquimarina]WQG86405.1 DUF6714 family protein [Kangiella aquimarina]